MKTSSGKGLFMMAVFFLIIFQFSLYFSEAINAKEISHQNDGKTASNKDQLIANRDKLERISKSYNDAYLSFRKNMDVLNADAQAYNNIKKAFNATDWVMTALKGGSDELITKAYVDSCNNLADTTASLIPIASLQNAAKKLSNNVKWIEALASTGTGNPVAIWNRAIEDRTEDFLKNKKCII